MYIYIYIHYFYCIVFPYNLKITFSVIYLNSIYQTPLGSYLHGLNGVLYRGKYMIERAILDNIRISVKNDECIDYCYILSIYILIKVDKVKKKCTKNI